MNLILEFRASEYVTLSVKRIFIAFLMLVASETTFTNHLQVAKYVQLKWYHRLV